jgi:nitrate/nitrite transporter NarK
VSSSDEPLRFSALLALMVAGEMVFSLPFHVARYFRPSVLEGLGLSNSELGDVFAIYGVTAMLSYLPGGVAADRFRASTLMCGSLIATAAGGAYMATLPTHVGLVWLYGYWGVTTIFLFWAAMIRATRGLGGTDTQGRAFGILDGGRGLAAAVAASVAVEVFARAVAGTPDAMTSEERLTALRAVVGFYTVATLAAAWLVWRYVPDDDDEARDEAATSARANVATLIGWRASWLQAAIVVCAYCGYKGLDNYALYAVDVLGMSEIDSARFTAMSAYVRPVAALAAGLVADRSRATRVVVGLFAVLAAAYLLLGLLSPTPGLAPIVYGNLFVTFVAVFGLRGVYFALLEESGVPKVSTGRAVGLISLVGFTPDVFFAPLAGRLLDASPGVAGHQHYFLLLTGISIAGGVAAAALAAAARSRRPGSLDGRLEV